MTYDLTGRAAIVTGANRGLGLSIARQLAQAGADVMMTARDGALLEREAETLRRDFSDRTILFEALDVTSQAACEANVEAAIAAFGKVDILVNNAGIYGPMGPLETVDLAAWRDALDINLMGSLLMMRAVIPAMKAQGAGSIIQISGGGATSPMANITAYAASKAAVVRLAESMALELAPHGIRVNSIAPGALNTRLLDEVLEAGPEAVGQGFYEKSLKQRDQGGTPLSVGGDLAVFLASDASEGITGRLISAVWDKWADWPDHLDELKGSDVYTLRRIAGRDRGMEWGDK